MSDSEDAHTPHSADLSVRRVDWTVSALKAGLSAIPFAGSFLAELAGDVIPHQRVDRLVAFAELLEQRLGTVERAIMESHRTDGHFTDLMAEAMRQASVSVTQERRQYLANLISRVVHELSSGDADLVQFKHLLALLGELNDIEVLWLHYYSRDVMFRAGRATLARQNPEIFGPIPTHMSAPASDHDRYAVRKSYKEHLVRLGLLDRDLKIDSKTKLPEFDSSEPGGMKISNYSFTRLGEMLLHLIQGKSGSEALDTAGRE